MNAATIGIILTKLIAAVMLFAALGHHPYDYYTLLRWVTCGVCAYTAYQAVQKDKLGWVWVFAIAALVMNPIIPVHLKRDTWALVDVVLAVLLLVSIAVMDIRQTRP